ncbi:MAG: class I SAM-dependent methyltransferase [Thermoplasmata archaeon]|nr:class I SAM-dependent methyltransferase [Thermoplasmata archaeon]
MISNKFDPAHTEILEDESRKEIMDVEKILESVSSYVGTSVADVGCGPGYFSIPISKRIGPGGEVYAIDLEIAMLEKLKENIIAQSGIHPILSKEESVPEVQDESVDTCFMVNLLHELEGNQTLREGYRILIPGGHLILIDWKKIKMDFGPPYTVRISERDAKRRCSDVGFKCESSFFAGQYNFGLVLKKPE